MRAATIALLAAVGIAAPAAGGTVAAPSLRVVDRSPVTVRGSAFHARELVSVRLAMRGRSWVRRAAADEAGSVRVRFAVSLHRCERFSLQAFGSAGSRARLFPTAPQPDCAPGTGSSTN